MFQLATVKNLIPMAALFIGCLTVCSASAVEPDPDKQVEADSGIAQQVGQIDKMVAEVWDAYQIRPSKPATDSEWCRRVFLDVIGRIPSADEAMAFGADNSNTKKQKLIETLLYDDVYTEEFARNWTTVWTNLLIGRTGGTVNGSMISREGMQKYLRDSFARNKPYDQFVHQLISATGTTVPGGDDFNGATNFLIDKVNQENASLATSETTKIFLGLQVQCTQCHNHPFNDWKQQKYWEMNAFFRQVRAVGKGMRAGDMNAVGTLSDRDFAGENGNSLEEAEVYYELRNGLVAVAYPVFVDGTEISRSGYVKETNRRTELADLTVKSPFFSKSIVNRMWAHFLGYGFTSPADDLGPHNVPTHPALLDYLGQEFQSNEHDLRQLISWIVLSKPYGLSSRQNKSNVSDDPLLGEPPKFSHFYLRQMEAEQLYESLIAATEGAESNGSYAEQERIKNNWLQQFNRAFGTDEGGESTSFNGTIPQVLMMFNGEMIKAATSTAKGSLIDAIVSSPMSSSQKIETLFWKGLGRKPKRAEISLAQSLIEKNGGNFAEGLRDMWWVILNTNEFIFIH